MLREISFSIGNFKKVKDRLFISGRCCQQTIGIGDKFSSISKYVPHSGNGRQGDTYQILKECQLEVIAILAYRNYLNQLHPGLTAEIELKEKSLCTYKTGLYLHGFSGIELCKDVKILGKGEFNIETI